MGARTGVMVLLAGVFLSTSSAEAAPAAARDGALRVTPAKARAGDAVVVRVDADPDAPSPAVVVAGRKLQLHAVRGGHEGIFAIPLEEKADTVRVRVSGDDATSVELPVEPREQQDVAVEVEEIFVDPPKDVRVQIERDQAAVARAYRDGPDELVTRRPFIWPRARRITGHFGDRRLFNGTVNSVHEGTDLAGAVGDPVRAANDGVVVLSEDLFYSGKTVIVGHGAGVYSAYLHLGGLGPEVGTQVRRGQLIGKVGETGRTTGPHLHFAIHADGRYIDPESFMRLRLSPATGGAVAADRADATTRRSGRRARSAR